MGTDVEVLQAFHRAPLKTLRPMDLIDLTSHPRRVVDRLESRGAVTRVAHGVYTVPPDGQDGREWRPEVEAAAMAVATARFGQRRAILMGIGAARHWKATPRAISDTVVAVPVGGRSVITLAHGGRAHFIHRDLGRLDAVLERLELGDALVTTREQTLLDLLARPAQGGHEAEARAAAIHLRNAVDPEAIARLMQTTPTRINDRIRRALFDDPGAGAR